MIFCDNMSVLHMINNSSSSCEKCMLLIKAIILQSLGHNVRFFVKYVNTKKNKYADLLSRLRVKEFLPLAIWPITKFWIIPRQPKKSSKRKLSE